MGRSFSLGRYLGIEVKVHWTFFLLLAFFGVLGLTQTGSPAGALALAGLIVLLFVFVVLHEYGHALVARGLGYEVEDIVLLPMGGMARLKTFPEKALDELKIAIAGPPVNVALAALFYGAAYLFYGISPLAVPHPAALVEEAAGYFLSYLGLVNVILAVFNLLPAFPMDGGRVLRAFLSTRMDRVRATEIAAAVGQAFAILFFVIGLLTFNLILTLVAVFIFLAAAGEAQAMRQRELMRGLIVADVMRRGSRTETLAPEHPFERVLEALIHGHQEDFPVLDERGRLVGMLYRNDIFDAARSREHAPRVGELMRRRFPTISPQADLFEEAHRLLQENDFRTLPVCDGEELVGLLSMEDLGQASLLRRLPVRGYGTLGSGGRRPQP
ncbi:site-2 protease family protein [Rubrobacter taiwanensis]|jgi:Zn-dependent protease/CBS domain-containing protein|uniref:Zinc metalloprotease n=1 Tax=Rubrobacter taiwanensis TaxID=185139 RepID=A0A4R1BFB8_9ACTN|nr:site-2 protease family protein [Rubrobacter taiwanensis]TCJ15851.1 site-2 protease family protein [Rubrobacter taiwanensis]